MAKEHQLQWRNHPNGEWRFHSNVEESVAKEQIGHYKGRWGELRAFDYQVVPKDSPRALKVVVNEPLHVRTIDSAPIAFLSHA